MKNNNLTENPALLLIGNPEVTQANLIELLQKNWCSAACRVCIYCTKIQTKQFEHVTWISPEKNYTLDHLQPIFDTMRFSLDIDKKHFFVIENADFLSVACANNLLKPIEDPAPGYRFILLAQHLDRLLPTITSRCTIYTYKSDSEKKMPVILHHLTSTNSVNATQFLSELEALNPNEKTTLEWLEFLTRFWTDMYKKSLQKNDTRMIKKSHATIILIKKLSLIMPMPGSSKLFWKNSFLQFKSI